MLDSWQADGKKTVDRIGQRHEFPIAQNLFVFYIHNIFYIHPFITM